ncbi:hypothetical protein MSG28_011082 [Choristoneura fumiferana]|uniref:Uncharacterized protein n=1 Tax=Choristoneura fumiferana TaxID=7141 RepID=A0ACC0KQA8_CHOFU|nr:hypothetical protein MSG28_011082 [Choristoneura fumiferana]
MATGGGVEPASLEYMEDPYFVPPDDDSTPSFDVAVDELDGLEELAPAWARDDADAGWRALPDLADAALCIETEFYMDNRRRRLRIFKKKMREVRVTFQDLSKPYLAKVSSHTNYKKFLGITPGAEEAVPGAGAGAGDVHTPEELVGLTPEQAEQLRAEWSRELARIRQSSELKRKLGITVWKEITEDVNQGLKNVKESQVYQKTESVIKSTAEKTTSILGGFTAGVSTKLGQMRNSEVKWHLGRTRRKASMTRCATRRAEPAAPPRPPSPSTSRCPSARTGPLPAPVHAPTTARHGSTKYLLYESPADSINT